MASPRRLFVAALAALLTGPALALDCPDMPAQSQQDWEVEVKSAVKRIGSAGGADLQTRTRRATTDLLGRLPRADKVYIEQMMFASYCSALRDNPALTGTERERRIKAYTSELRQTLYGATAAPPAAQDARELARHELERIPVKYGADAFIASVSDGRAAVAGLFLKAGIDPDSADQNGNTALMYAASRGDLAIVEALLRAKASVDKPNRAGGTPLSWAAGAGRTEVLRILLARGVSQGSIDAAFGAAAARGALEALRLLAQRVADPRQIATKVLPAAVYGQSGDDQAAPMVRQLLALGAAVDAQDDGGWGALAYAAAQGYPLVTRTLIEAKADADRRCSCQGYGGGEHTALTLAVMNGHDAIVAMLLDAGASVKVRDGNGRTPLLLAIARRRDIAMVKRLLGHGADPNDRDPKNNTALMIGSDNVDVVRALLASGAAVNARDAAGSTALMRAAADGRTDSIAALLDAGGDIHARSDLGRTPLVVAVRNDAADAVRLLLDRGARVNERDGDDKTALAHARELAAGDTRTRIISMLTQAGGQ